MFQGTSDNIFLSTKDREMKNNEIIYFGAHAVKNSVFKGIQAGEFRSTADMNVNNITSVIQNGVTKKNLKYVPQTVQEFLDALRLIMEIVMESDFTTNFHDKPACDFEDKPAYKVGMDKHYAKMVKICKSSGVDLGFVMDNRIRGDAAYHGTMWSNLSSEALFDLSLEMQNATHHAAPCKMCSSIFCNNAICNYLRFKDAKALEPKKTPVKKDTKKTVCRNFAANQTCSYGNSCKFLHKKARTSPRLDEKKDK